jgi:uncharacterized protein (TIGR02453 family)
MPFSDDSLNFLFENRVADSKPWFLENREKYETLVLEPLRQLVRDLTPTMLEIDPLFIAEPKIGKCISRIYRDTRFTNDKHIFRDYMWITFTRGKRRGDERPGFYFELSPYGWGYGCGWYRTGADTMDALRDMVKNDDKLYKSAKNALKKAKNFTLEDTRYKRTRHPDQPEEKRLWLDQRTISVNAHSEDFALLYSDDLADFLIGEFRRIKPIYAFLIEAESRAHG